MDERKPDPLGWSLAVEGGDLAWSGEDLASVAGLENLHQGLTHGILTPYATDVFNVAYGFNVAESLAQPVGRLQMKQLIHLQIIRSLSLDDRVLEVREVVFDDDPRFFELAPGSDPDEARQVHALERRWRVVVLVALVTGEEAALSLTGTGLAGGGA